MHLSRRCERRAHWLKDACHFLRASRSALRPVPINQRIASEREGLSGSVLRQSSMACLKCGLSRKVSTGSCPIAGLPRFLRNTTFEFDMLCITKKTSQGESGITKKKAGLCDQGCLAAGCDRREAGRDSTFCRNLSKISTHGLSGCCSVASVAG